MGEARVAKGFVRSDRNWITREGMSNTKPEGGILAPLLCNIVLDGMRLSVKTKRGCYIGTLWKRGKNSKSGVHSSQHAFNRVRFVRYADDFIITSHSKEQLEDLSETVKKWLRPTRLKLNEEKSRIVHLTESFEFLRFKVNQRHDGKARKRGMVYKFEMYPSRESQKKIVQEVKSLSKKIWQQDIGSRKQFILQARLKVLNWAYYFQTGQCSKVFHSIDNRIWKMLKKRTKVLYRGKKAKRRWKQIFPKGVTYTFNRVDHHDQWVLSILKSNRDPLCFLPKMSWVQSKKHIKVKKDKTPFDRDAKYWLSRIQHQGPFSTSVQNLLRKQKGLCSLCRGEIRFGQSIQTDHIKPKALSKAEREAPNNSYDNLQAVHSYCHMKKTLSDLKKIAETKKLAKAKKQAKQLAKSKNSKAKPKKFCSFAAIPRPKKLVKLARSK